MDKDQRLEPHESSTTCMQLSLSPPTIHKRPNTHAPYKILFVVNHPIKSINILMTFIKINMYNLDNDLHLVWMVVTHYIVLYCIVLLV